jgi:hypothetical protein
MIRPGNGGRRGVIRKRASRGDAASSTLGLCPVWRGSLYRPLAKIVASSCGGTISSWSKVHSCGFLSSRQQLRCVAKTRPLHMVISDLDHQLRTKRLPSEILALAPAAQTARTALTALVVQGPIFPNSRGTREESPMTISIPRQSGTTSSNPASSSGESAANLKKYHGAIEPRL